LALSESSRAGSLTVTVPTAASMPSASPAPKNGTWTAPLLPDAPRWTCPATGAPMPVQLMANESWLPLMRSTARAWPSGSPTLGLPAGPGTSLRPLRAATKKVAAPVGSAAAAGAVVPCGPCAWAICATVNAAPVPNTAAAAIDAVRRERFVRNMILP